MHKIFLLLLTLAFLPSLLEAFPPLLGDKRPARQIRITDKTVYRSAPGKDPVIVVPRGSSAVAVYAAGELQAALQKTLGRKIQISPDPVAGKYPIILGLNDLTRKEIDANRLCRDGFFIKITAEKTIIAGRDTPGRDPKVLLKKRSDHMAYLHNYERATYFGVLDFVERFAGVRYYFPVEELNYFPRQELALPEAFIFDRPDFEMRWHSPFNGFYDDPEKPGSHARESTPAKMLNWYRNRMETFHIANNHGLHHLAIYNRFAKTHPEYLAETALRDGSGKPKISSNHFCYSRGLEKEVIKDAKAYFAGQKPQTRQLKRWSPSQAGYGCFSVMPSDAMQACRCQLCSKYFQQKNGKGGGQLLWNFTFDIADALARAGVQGWITQNVYDRASEMPERAVPENVLLTVCFSGPCVLGDKAAQVKEYQKIRDWYKKAGKKLIYWNYAHKGNSSRDIPLFPDTFPRALAKYYKDNAPYTYGAMIESGTDHYIFHYLTYYIYGKVCWNTQADTDKLLNEHFRLLFGPAADLMQNFFDQLEHLWLYRINGQTIMTAIGPVSGSVSKKELYEEICNDKKINEFRQLFDQAAKRCAKDKMQLKRIAFIRRHFLGSLEKGLDDYKNFGSSRSEFGCEVPLISQPVKVDGKTDDPAWANAGESYLKPFHMKRKVSIPETSVKVCRDKEKLYVSFDCVEPDYANRQASLPGTKDHSPWNDDGVEVFLMSDPNRQRYYQIVLNSAGVIIARRWNNTGGKFYPDPPCRLVPQGAVARTSKGWSAEIAIPLAALEGFNGKELAANFCRHRRVETESYATWSPFILNKFHECENFGKLFFAPRNRSLIVKNPDFNGPLRGPYFPGGSWNIPYAFRKTGKVALDTENFVYGKNSVKFSGLAKNQRTGLIQSVNGRLKPDTEYRISFYIKCDQVVKANPHKICGAWAGMTFDNKTLQFPTTGFSGTFPWRYHTQRFRTPKSFKNALITLRFCFASGSVNFDRVTLEECQ